MNIDIIWEELVFYGWNDKQRNARENSLKKNKVNSFQTFWGKTFKIIANRVYKWRKYGCSKTTQQVIQTKSSDETITIFITCLDSDNQRNI